MKDDWAEKRAREWLERTYYAVGQKYVDSLAEMLRGIPPECVCSACGAVAIHRSEQ